MTIYWIFFLFVWKIRGEQVFACPPFFLRQVLGTFWLCCWCCCRVADWLRVYEAIAQCTIQYSICLSDLVCDYSQASVGLLLINVACIDYVSCTICDCTLDVLKQLHLVELALDIRDACRVATDSSFLQAVRLCRHVVYTCIVFACSCPKSKTTYCQESDGDSRSPTTESVIASTFWFVDVFDFVQLYFLLFVCFVCVCFIP